MLPFEKSEQMTPWTHWFVESPMMKKLSLLLIPLFVFDVVSIKRIHPITLIGAGAILAAHTTINLLEGSPTWHNFAHATMNAIR